jgi:hypothetical protein
MTMSGGTNVRAWHLPDGLLIWEAAIPSSKGSNPLRLVALPVRDKKMGSFLCQ